MKLVTTTSLLIAAVALSGCATILSKNASSWGHEYSGIVCSFKNIKNYWILLPLTIIDVPLSIIADMLVLPVDLMKDNPGGLHGCLTPWENFPGPQLLPRQLLDKHLGTLPEGK
jgi:uncharacterized protein YceK